MRDICRIDKGLLDFQGVQKLGGLWWECKWKVPAIRTEALPYPGLSCVIETIRMGWLSSRLVCADNGDFLLNRK